MSEHSPTLQRWVARPTHRLSPEGTVELRPVFGRPFGTVTSLAILPSAEAEALGNYRTVPPGRTSLASRSTGPLARRLGSIPDMECGFDDFDKAIGVLVC